MNILTSGGIREERKGRAGEIGNAGRRKNGGEGQGGGRVRGGACHGCFPSNVQHCAIIAQIVHYGRTVLG